MTERPAPESADLAALERRLDDLVESLAPAMVRVRRHLHAHPEIGWEERETQRFLRDFLAGHGVATRDCAGTGLVADIGEGAVGVLYRGDIDALPITESKDPEVEYVSSNPGVCHACGHDAHAAVAATLAVAFHRMGAELPGRVRVVLQPAEEVVPSGAERMVAEGVVDGVDAALAIHVDPARDCGTVGVRTGPLTSATDSFSIVVRGQSGHSARPYLARDAILAAADVVRALYTVIGQRVNPVFPAVLNVGTIRGGEARNVIAGEVRLEGVVRTLHPDVRDQLHRELDEAAVAAARVHGCAARFELVRGAPPVMNDPALHGLVRAAAEQVVGASNVADIEHPSTGAEDFAVFGEHVPQYMLRVGVRAPGAPTHHLHTPEFDVDERALALAARIMGRAVLRALARRVIAV